MCAYPIRPQLRTPRSVVRLRIALPSGEDPARPFMLIEGGNPFVCLATYIDGVEEPFDAYWTCPLFQRDGGVQSSSVFGRQRRRGVTITASARHERYHELACWALMPEPDSLDIPSDGIGLDYSNFN